MDAVPLMHGQLALAPLLEVALLIVETSDASSLLFLRDRKSVV